MFVGDIEPATQVLKKWGAFKNNLKASKFRSGVDDWYRRMQQNAFATVQKMLQINTGRLQHLQNQAEHDRNELAIVKQELARTRSAARKRREPAQEKSQACIESDLQGCHCCKCLGQHDG